MGPPAESASNEHWSKDAISGLVVFLVALPLCLGVALASKASGLDDKLNVPLVSGVIAGIIGGVIVGLLSGSHTSVSGPAAGLTAVVAAEVLSLGSFQTFLLALVLAGCLQMAMGLLRAGFLASYVPSSVIKGLLAAIGVILILKQFPHLLGHDNDPEGEMAFNQPDEKNTFTELFEALKDVWDVISTGVLNEFEIGAAAIGFGSLAILFLWDRIKLLKKSIVPSALVVVLVGVVLSELLRPLGGHWDVGPKHLVSMPIAGQMADYLTFLTFPDFRQFANVAVYIAAFKIAIVASLETLLNLEAVDKIDPKQRNSPPSRELFAQGVGNAVAGLIGGLPVTSVIVRSSVNINSGSRTKASAIIHGVILLASLLVLAPWLNHIPLSCLAAILVYTGFKLVNPKLVKQMWQLGLSQFIPFVSTVVAIVLSDLLIGVVIGLAISIVFMLRSNMKRPIGSILENHLGVNVVRIDLGSQVSFLNKARLLNALDAIPEGEHVLIDATNSKDIDTDVLDMIRDYQAETAPARGVHLSLRSFSGRFPISDQILFPDYSTQSVQAERTPEEVLGILKEGHARFRNGVPLRRDNSRTVNSTAGGQHPLAVLLTCIDSRTPVELLFDVGIGDVFVIRIAGNISGPKVLGSMEYATAVAGAKLIVVVGHTRCGAVTAAVQLREGTKHIPVGTECQHLNYIVDDIQISVKALAADKGNTDGVWDEREIDEVAKRNVQRVVRVIAEQSETLRALVASGQVKIVGAMYDVATGTMEFLPPANGQPA